MKKILYVEDNEDNIFMLTKRLTRAGYDIFVARNGAEGVERAQEIMPDLILMDLGMPVMDGWKAISCLRAMPETKSIPIIAFSSHVTTDERQRAYDVGCSDFDTKPINTKRLLEKIKTLLCKKNAA